MQHENPLVAFGKHPMITLLIGSLLSLGGNAVVRFFTLDTSTATVVVKVENLDRRVSANEVAAKDAEKRTMSREEFQVYTSQERQILEDIRSEVRDIKHGLFGNRSIR